MMLLLGANVVIAPLDHAIASGTSGATATGDVAFQLQIDPKRKGTIRCALYRDEKTWLGDTPFRTAVASPSAPLVTCRFRNVPKGNYAAAALHDEDDNKKMTKNVLGLPTEGYAASRNAHVGVLGPPKWDAAVFAHRSGEHTVERAEMKY
ncbi:hypothetical protein AKJ09_08730 [Labilithrix luteola]|uniref:DUF2141 domain-containing protein n=1 Tax=Labilithrix luteola TaxID=1391654 RepID=A0A0K1Q8R2_9BACT|nr:hypothetical protein AKJ09_08730 [Labilithrix luteola]